MTLIAVYKNSGDRGSVCVGRCDARCYEAKTPDCDCIYKGANHGAGKERAISNTETMAEQWMKEYETRQQLQRPIWDLPLNQQTLF